MSEEIIGRISGLQRSDSKIFNLIFTNNRMVAEFVGGTGGAFFAFGVVGAAVAESHLKKKASQMEENKTPEEILSEHKKSFEINYLDIEKVTVSKGVLGSSILIELNQKIPKIGKNIVFSFSKKRMEEIEPVIIKVFSIKAVINK